MLHSLKELNGLKIAAIDQQIGEVKDALGLLKKAQMQGAAEHRTGVYPPVSRQYEDLLHKHYEWPSFSGTPIVPGYGVSEVPPPRPIGK